MAYFLFCDFGFCLCCDIIFRSFVNNSYTVLNAVADCLNFGNRILLFAFEVEKFCRKIKAYILKAVCSAILASILPVDNEHKLRLSKV